LAIGASDGGTCAQFAAALDTRIKATFVSGYLNTFRDSIMSVGIASIITCRAF